MLVRQLREVGKSWARSPLPSLCAVARSTFTA